MSGTRAINKIETLAVIKFLFLQDKAPKEINTILTETLACFRPGWAKDLSAPLVHTLIYVQFKQIPWKERVHELVFTQTLYSVLGSCDRAS